MSLELKHHLGQDVIFSLTETISVVKRPEALFVRCLMLARTCRPKVLMIKGVIGQYVQR